MRGNHKKANNETRHELTSDIEDDMDEIKKSVFEPFIRTNIELREIKINNQMKLSCPFQNRQNLDWKILIDNYFDSLSLYDHPKFSQNFYQRMLSLSENENKDELSQYINEKINILTDHAVVELLSQTELTNFYEKLEKIQISLQNLNTIFGQLCGDVKKFIISNIRSHLNQENIRKFRDLIQSIINEFSHNENSEIVLLIIRFFTQFDLLTKEIKDHFSSTFINTITNISKKSRKTPLENTAKLYCKLCQIFPIGETSILEKITKNYLKNVLKMDLHAFIAALAPDIIDYFDDIYNFVYSTNEVNSLINYFIGYYGNNSKRFVFDEALKNFRLFKNFSTEIKIKIALSIRRCISKNDESVAIRYAEIIDESFREENEHNNFDETNYDMLDEMYLIQNRDVFESAHFARMLQRSTEISMVPDQKFVDKYKLHFGEYSATRFESLLNDYNESTKLTDEFKATNEIPPFLNIHVFYSCNWSRKYRVLTVIPDIVKSYLENFSIFYKAKMPRRFIEWSPHLSNCVLNINEITIKCNGITAAILYSLKNGPKTSEEIAQELFYDVDEVEKILNNLKGSNYGNFILMKNDEYSINEEASPDGDSINFLKRSPQDNKTEERKERTAIMTSRGRQVESVIILCLKGHPAIKETELFNIIGQRLKFILDPITFEEKLHSLAIKRFIKRDTDEGTVTYIP